MSRPTERDPNRCGSFRNLLAWQQGIELAKLCYVLTRGFPREELYGLTNQIRRAAVSVPANIAEGTARGTTKDFVSFLRIAAGSLRELETHLVLSVEIGLATTEAVEPAIQQLNSVSYLVQRLIASQEHP